MAAPHDGPALVVKPLLDGDRDDVRHIEGRVQAVSGLEAERVFAGRELQRGFGGSSLVISIVTGPVTPAPSAGAAKATEAESEPDVASLQAAAKAERATNRTRKRTGLLR